MTQPFSVAVIDPLNSDIRFKATVIRCCKKSRYKGEDGVLRCKQCG